MRKKIEDRERGLLIHSLGSHAPEVEAFRALRTNLQFAGVKTPLRSILITSVTPQDGKSSIAANLAAVMALAGTSTILIDADLRKPVQSQIFFGSSGQVGLTNVLLGSLKMEDVVMETAVRGLKLLPSGTIPPNPAELLGTEVMGEVIEKAEGMADLVIIDTSPLLPVTDAALLAPRTDGVLLLVRAGWTQRQEAVQAKQILENVHARILGVVVNDVRPEHGRHYDYYYGQDRQEEGGRGRFIFGYLRPYLAWPR